MALKIRLLKEKAWVWRIILDGVKCIILSSWILIGKKDELFSKIFLILEI